MTISNKLRYTEIDNADLPFGCILYNGELAFNSNNNDVGCSGTTACLCQTAPADLPVNGIEYGKRYYIIKLISSHPHVDKMEY